MVYVVWQWSHWSFEVAEWDDDGIMFDKKNSLRQLSNREATPRRKNENR